MKAGESFDLNFFAGFCNHFVEVVADGFIRISVGVEDIEDLLDDLGRGFEAIG